MEREKQLRESDIRPQDAHAAWRDLVQNDLAAWEHEGVCTEQTHCPGCGSEKTHEAFTVFSFPYRECALCGSMFSSRRPSPHAVQTFYQSAPSMQFLKEQIGRAHV